MKKGLVLEGGALRGVFTAGVLDAFLDYGIEFDGVIGESAGAIQGVSYISKQKGRAFKTTYDWCWSPKYMSWRSLFFTGNYFNVNFCYKKIPEMYPIDEEAFKNNPAEFYIACTNCKTAEPFYYNCKEISVDSISMKYLIASASMPIVARAIKIDGQKYVDGGIADSVPIKKFQSMGFEKNVVILTQKEKLKEEFNFFTLLSKIFTPFRRKLIKALETQERRYLEIQDYMKKEEKAGRVFIIRPQEDLAAGVMERDPEKIKITYEQGYNEALRIMDDLQKFLS